MSWNASRGIPHSTSSTTRMLKIMSKKDKNDYSSTLQLPRTSFSMRANLLNAEPLHQDRWDSMNLYEAIRGKKRAKGPYIFHDGPPYANGKIHMGHLLNKILKDLVVRSRLMMGYEVDYVPGWDCHGLPIEHKVMKELGDKARGLSILEIRSLCHDYAARYVELQSSQMKRLGTLADYGNPYLTMVPSYEGATLEVFAALVAEGLVYRDVKPVHWSIANKTALAEAELEYYDREDTSVYVLFDVEDPGLMPEELGLPEGREASLMIWTTTPWTLPANLAMAVAPEAEYSLYSFSFRGRMVCAVLAAELAPGIFRAGEIDSWEVLGSCTGRVLSESGLSYTHPFIDRKSPVVIAEYVTMEDGTGLVHTAPGHGAEDYLTGLKEKLLIYCPVLGDGTFDDTVPEWLAGVDVWTANGLVVEHLRASGHLFYDHRYVHSYPHDWRSKTPTIFRATEQWFVAVDRPFGKEGKSLREMALEAAAEKVDFVPGWGRSRMEGMLESRPDWCISRQRSWGLPIPVFLLDEDKVLITEKSVSAVARVIREEGSDFWFSATPAELLKYYDPSDDPQAPNWIDETGGWLEMLQKSRDIFDVWFESGSSWNGVLNERGIGYPADLYLEGSDQHRGWFQLSLLPALGATGQSPFRTVLTHGFMVDANGRKMSKSEGNAVDVEDVLKQHGADICRWWVCSLNYTNDIKVDWEFFKVAGDEYRKVRNTIRFLLGNLNDFDPDRDYCPPSPEDCFSIDAWAWQKLAEFVETTTEGYEKFQFKKVSDTIFNFCNDSMSAVYLVAVKDRLYCDAADSRKRRRTQTVIYEIARALIRTVAPILVHTAEEAWLALNDETMESSDSVHFQLLPEVPARLENEADWAPVMEFRHKVLKALEEVRAGDGGLKNPLDAGVRAVVTADEAEALRPFREELADILGVSRMEVAVGGSPLVEIDDLRNEPRCERSWKRDLSVKARPDGGMLSDRDAQVIGSV